MEKGTHDSRRAGGSPTRTNSSALYYFLIAVLLIGGLAPAVGIHQLIEKFLLTPLPVEEPGRLVHFDRPQSYPTVRFLREASRTQASPVVDYLAWYSGLFTAPMPFRDSEGRESRISYDLISGNGLGLLGVHPVLGRILSEQDEAGLSGAPTWACDISYACWTKRFAHDPRILNTVVKIHDAPVRVVGVLPESFNGLMPGEHAEVFLPFPFIEYMAPARRRIRYLDDARAGIVDVYGRMRGPVHLSAVQKYIDGIVPALLRANAVTGPNRQIIASKLAVSSGEYGHSWLRETYEKPLIVLDLLALAMMILSASAIYWLTALRQLSREACISIKLALGAPSRRLLHEESIRPVLVILLSAAIAFFSASRLTTFVARPFLAALPKLQSFDLSYGIAAAGLPVTICLALCAAILIMTASTIRSAAGTLPYGIRAATTGNFYTKRRAGAVIFLQTAMASLLIASSTVLCLNFRELLSIDPGIPLRHLAQLRVEMQPNGNSDVSPEAPASSILAARVLKLAQGTPGTESISIVGNGLFHGSSNPVLVQTPSVETGRASHADLELQQVSPGFFQLMSISLRAGREFTWEDGPSSCMLDDLGARLLFHGEYPVGKVLAYTSSQDAAPIRCTVVGISRPVATFDIRRPAAPSIIVPYLTASKCDLPWNVLARSGDIGGSFVRQFTTELAAIDPRLSISRVEDLHKQVDESFGRERIMAILSLVFGICSLVVAGVGFFSSLFYQIGTRTAEYGIRMALGADRLTIARPLIGQAAIQCIPAIALGVAVAVWMSHLAATFLFDPQLAKPGVCIASCAFLLAVLLACVAAALVRIHRLDPAEALRTL